jgi:hypothetical protein
MMIIPEIQTVVIQPPGTGSASIKGDILKKYPAAFSPYRHMECGGIPIGYDVWRRVCIVRRPLERLHSIYRYMSGVESSALSSQSWATRLRADVARTFEDWLIQSREVFTDPWDINGSFDPYCLVLDRTPIARKSQRVWIEKCETCVDILRLEHPRGIESRLGISLSPLNAGLDVEPMTMPLEVTAGIQAFLAQYHSWDLERYT